MVPTSLAEVSDRTLRHRRHNLARHTCRSTAKALAPRPSHLEHFLHFSSAFLVSRRSSLGSKPRLRRFVILGFFVLATESSARVCWTFGPCPEHVSIFFGRSGGLSSSGVSLNSLYSITFCHNQLHSHGMDPVSLSFPCQPACRTIIARTPSLHRTD